MKKLLTIASLALVMVSCSNDDNSHEITVRTKIGSMTRTEINTEGKTVFSLGDAFLLYAWDGTASAAATPWIDGTKVTQTATDMWTPEATLYWKSEATKHDFIAVYPAAFVDKNVSLIAQPYTFRDANAGGYKLLDDDVLLARLSNVTMTADYSLTLPFEHIMSKLRVVLTFRNEWDGVPTVTAVTANMTRQSTINCINGTVSPLASSATDRKMLAAASNSDNSRCFEIVCAPNDPVLKRIVTTISNRTFTFTSPELIPLEPGKVTTVNLVVGRNTIDLDFTTPGGGEGGGSGEGGQSGITIGDWTDHDTSISGDAFGD